MVHSRVVVLGPQRLQPTLADAVASLGIKGRLGAVTAGWEERESEDQELAAHLHGRTTNLALYERADGVFRYDTELHKATRERQDRIRRSQELYRLRLAHQLEAARELCRRESLAGYEGLVAPQLEGAIAGLRALDDEHVQRIRSIHVEFQLRWKPFERESIALQRRELEATLKDCSALCIAGGNVGILLNRLRMFGVLDMLRGQPIFAWSAGAMVLTERIVLFHDFPPQGAGDPEVLEAGLGAVEGLVALPHADRRLALDDRARVSLFARRFAPALCAALAPRTRLDWSDGRWSGESGTRRLCADGALAEVGT
jgi:hypothetical protein